MFWGISTLVQTEVQKKRRRHQTFLFRGRGDSWIYSSCSWRRVGLNKRQEGTGNWKQAAWKQVLFYHSAMFNLFLFLLKTHNFPMPLSVFFCSIFLLKILFCFIFDARTSLFSQLEFYPGSGFMPDSAQIPLYSYRPDLGDIFLTNRINYEI